MTTTHPIAWLMRAAGCDGSADWIEPGAAEPEPMAGFEPIPLGDVREMQAALRLSRGNVASLGPAMAIEPHTPYRPWLAELDRVIARAEGGAA